MAQTGLFQVSKVVVVAVRFGFDLFGEIVQALLSGFFHELDRGRGDDNGVWLRRLGTASDVFVHDHRAAFLGVGVCWIVDCRRDDLVCFDGIFMIGHAKQDRRMNEMDHTSNFSQGSLVIICSGMTVSLVKSVELHKNSGAGDHHVQRVSNVKPQKTGLTLQIHHGSGRV